MNELAQLRSRIAELEKLEIEHKLTIEILQASENKYRTLLENLPQKIFHKDKNSVYVSCNNNYARDLKIQSDEIIGKRDYDFYTRELAEKYRADDIRIMESGKTEYIEEKYIQNGQEVVVQTVKTPLYDGEGNTIGILGIFWDITDRKRAEEDLKAAHKRFEDVLNSVDSLVYAIDMKTYEVLFINRFGRDNWGEIEGEICWQTLQKGQSGPCEFCTNKRLIGPDGKPSETVVWDIQNTSDKRWYECRDRAIYWPDGRLVRIEIATDITGRKQMEQALRQSEHQFKSTFENAAVGMAHVGLDGRLLRVNDTFCRITGYPPAELITKTFQEITHPEDLEEDVAQARELAEGRIPHYSMEKRYFRKDGSIVWVNLTVSVQRDHTGQPTHFISVVENISPRKKIEEALKESEERYRTIIEFSNDMIWILDTGGLYQFVNKRCEEFSGLKQDYFLGKSFIPFIDKNDLRKVIDVFHKALNGEPQQYEVSVKKEDGSNFFLLVNTAPIYSKEKVVGTVSFGRDITERKETDEQIKESLRQELEKSYENLRESEARYRDLFENANDAIFTSDAEGHIITANNATVRNLGCKIKDEVIGTHFSDWLTPESIQNAQNNKRKYLSGEPVKQPVLHEFIWKNGEHRWAEIISRIIKEGDKAIALHCIARDITERIKLEQELKESEAKYRELFENSLDAMYVVDIEGNVLKMNQAGLRILNCSKDEVIGNNISKWLTPKSLKIVENRLEKWRTGEIVNQTDILELVCGNHEHRWVEIKTR